MLHVLEREFHVGEGFGPTREDIHLWMGGLTIKEPPSHHPFKNSAPWPGALNRGDNPRRRKNPKQHKGDTTQPASSGRPTIRWRKD